MENHYPGFHAYQHRVRLLRDWFCPGHAFCLSGGGLVLEGKGRRFCLTANLEVLSLPQRGQVSYRDFQEWFSPSLDAILLTDAQWEEVIARVPDSNPEMEAPLHDPFRSLRRQMQFCGLRNHGRYRLEELREFASAIPDSERQRLAATGLTAYGLPLLQMVRLYPGFDRLLETEPILASAVAHKAEDHFKGWMRRRPACLPEDGKWKHLQVLEYLGLEAGMAGVRILRRLLPWQFDKDFFQQWIFLSGRPEIVRSLSRTSGWLPAEVFGYLKMFKGGISQRFLTTLQRNFVQELLRNPGFATIPYSEVNENILLDSVRLADRCSNGWERLRRIQSMKGLDRLHDQFSAEFGWLEAVESCGGEEKLKAMFWEPPFPETPEFQSVRTPLELKEVAREFDNCALSFLSEVIAGQMALYRLNCGEPHLVSFERVPGGWWLYQNFRLKNREPLPEGRRWVCRYCKKNGIQAEGAKISLGVDPENLGLSKEMDLRMLNALG